MGYVLCRGFCGSENIVAGLAIRCFAVASSGVTAIQQFELCAGMHAVLQPL